MTRIIEILSLIFFLLKQNFTLQWNVAKLFPLEPIVSFIMHFDTMIMTNKLYDSLRALHNRSTLKEKSNLSRV